MAVGCHMFSPVPLLVVMGEFPLFPFTALPSPSPLQIPCFAVLYKWLSMFWYIVFCMISTSFLR
jgi:hypothetical protein